MSDEWKQHARIAGFQKRIAELERKNVELNVELGREARVAGLATVTMHEQYAKLARLQAVVRAAKRPANLPALLLTIKALERDDLKGVK